MSSPPALLKARSLGRKIPGSQRWLFQEIDLDVAAGERVAVVGPTGAGKTLLLRALAALDPIDDGEIIWQDQPIADKQIPAFRRHAVYLHQRPAMFDGTVEANLRMVFSLGVHRDAEYRKQRAMELLEQAGCEADFLTKDAAQLSGGEAQITALVRAVQCDPLLLMLDEPTASLDHRTAAAVEQMILNWQQADAGRALIWVSHDPSQVLRVATREFSLGKHASRT